MTSIAGRLTLIALVLLSPVAAGGPESETLALRLDLQSTKEQLREMTLRLAHCDLDYANARARIAGAQLQADAEALLNNRMALDTAAKVAGFAIDWSATPPIMKKLDAAKTP